MNKQIEQMARVTCQMYTPQYAKNCGGVGECNYKCLHYQRCECLYEMGYRKTSEVAREIFAEIEQAIFAHGTKYSMKRLEELKKKYEVTEDES